MALVVRGLACLPPRLRLDAKHAPQAAPRRSVGAEPPHAPKCIQLCETVPGLGRPKTLRHSDPCSPAARKWLEIGLLEVKYAHNHPRRGRQGGSSAYT